MNRKKHKVLICIFAIVVLIISVICIIEYTTNNPKTNSTIEQQINEEKPFIIETDYCKLYYPEKWKNKIEIKNPMNKRDVVEFYGLIEGKEKEKLFEIKFNMDSEYMIGTLNCKNKQVYVGFELMDFSFDDSWTEEDKNTIYAMQEDVNYLIGMLEKEKDFEKVN